MKILIALIAMPGMALAADAISVTHKDEAAQNLKYWQEEVIREQDPKAGIPEFLQAQFYDLRVHHVAEGWWIMQMTH